MEWKKLFEMQAQLDKYIEATHNMHGESKIKKKLLALLVEVGELANETRCFKFWSTKQPSERTVILEEFVDGIHFLMSIGLEKDYQFDGLTKDEFAKDVTEQFTAVFSSIIEFKQHPSETNYKQMFTVYLNLGAMLGFEMADIQAAYMDKNEINFERQDNGY